MTLYRTYIKQNRERFIEELTLFCRQPSVSMTGEGISTMAMIVADRLNHLGAETRMVAVDGSNPYIFAEIGSGPRTLLFYNHYDVQPARRSDGWTSDPFQPVIRGERFYARGVADNKANLLFRIHAIESYLAARRELPICVRFLVEGEEEIGSPHLPHFIEQHGDLLRADGCIWESGRKSKEGRPLLQLGLRGMLYVELSLQSASREVHSSWANIVENPALPLIDRLRQAVESLTDDQGRPTFGHLLADTPQPTQYDLALLGAIPFDLSSVYADLGGLPRPGLSRWEALRRLFFEPTCNICGLSAGFSEPGAKTVIPNRAVAKLDFRLPVGVSPDDVEDRLRTHLQSNGFGNIEVRRVAAIQAARTDPQAAIVRATHEAVVDTYGVEPVIHPLMPASGPMYDLCQARGVPAVTFGAGHAGDNVHGADENIYLDDYFQAMTAMGEIIRRFGDTTNGQ